MFKIFTAWCQERQPKKQKKMQDGDLLPVCLLFLWVAHFSPILLPQAAPASAAGAALTPLGPPLHGCSCSPHSITFAAYSPLPCLNTHTQGPYQRWEGWAAPSSQEGRGAALAGSAFPHLPITSSIHLWGLVVGLYARCWAFAEQRLPIVLHCT